MARLDVGWLVKVRRPVPYSGVHPSGARYRWVVAPDEAELAAYGSNSRRFRKWLRR
jgi:hypothetical protein